MTEKPNGTIVCGPPGCGKTQYTILRIIHMIKTGALREQDALILCFSVKKAQEIRERLSEMGEKYGVGQLLDVKVINIHKQAIRALQELREYRFGKHNRLLQDLIRISGFAKHPKYQKLDKSLEFDELIRDYRDLLVLGDSEAIPKYQLIAVDELQILDSRLIEVLMLIVREAGLPQLILAGDSNQDIFHWQKKKHADLDSFRIVRESLEDVYDLRQTRQLKNRRGTIELTTFRQGFEDVVKSGIVVRPWHKLQSGPKPHIVLVADQQAQTRKLDEIVSETQAQNPGEGLKVLARFKWFLFPYQEYEEYNATTIHSALGSDADHVVWADMSNIDAEEHSEAIIRVAISRAKKSLTIISTESQENIIKWFEPGTYTLQNLQESKPRSSIKKNRKKIKKGRNKTLNNRRYSDSVRLTVHNDAVPFNPQLHNNTAPRKGWIKEERRWSTLNLGKDTKITDLTTYSVVRYMRKGGKCFYSFDFKSLDMLARNRFDEKQILEACRNEVINFFEGRIKTSAIMVSKIDLAAYFLCDAEQKRMLAKRLWELDKGIGKFKKRSGYLYTSEGIKSQVWVDDSLSVYDNHGTKASGITVSGYAPEKKPERNGSDMTEQVDNRLSCKGFRRDDLYKIEIRLRGQKVVKKRLGTNSVDELIENARNLPDMYHTLVSELGIVNDGKVLGFEYERQNEGVFRVKTERLAGDLVSEVGSAAGSETSITANKINGLVSVGQGRGGEVRGSGEVFSGGLLYYTWLPQNTPGMVKKRPVIVRSTRDSEFPIAQNRAFRSFEAGQTMQFESERLSGHNSLMLDINPVIDAI